MNIPFAMTLLIASDVVIPPPEWEALPIVQRHLQDVAKGDFEQSSNDMHDDVTLSYVGPDNRFHLWVGKKSLPRLYDEVAQGEGRRLVDHECARSPVTQGEVICRLIYQGSSLQDRNWLTVVYHVFASQIYGVYAHKAEWRPNTRG